MGRRLAVVGVAVALVALAVSVVSPALGASGDDDRERTFRVVATFTEEAFVDVGDEGESLGDQFVFAARLSKRGEQVGRAGAVCTFVSLERQEAQCVATFWFGRGQITVQGLIGFAGELPPFAVTGGSGKYTGAEGVVHVREVTATKDVLTFRLED
jgi:hypothetical protein